MAQRGHKYKQACCIRIGPQCDIQCADIVTTDGIIVPSVSEMRYLGVFFVKSRNFRISLDYAKKSFYRALNAIFGKIGRAASAPVILEMVVKKCVPILLYGLEACPLNSSDKSSLDFMLNRFFMKLFNSGNMEFIDECKLQLGFTSVSLQLASRTVQFKKRFDASVNSFCQLTRGFAAASCIV